MRDSIDAIIDKKKQTQFRKLFTTLTPPTEDLRRVVVEYDSVFTHQFQTKFKKFGMDIVYSSRNNQIKTRLGSSKDPVHKLNRSGVYKITCPHCDMVYIGQTKRNLEIRCKEHFSEVIKAQKEVGKGLPHHFKSKVAEHIFDKKHPISTDNVCIIRCISSPWKLDVAESLEIYKQSLPTLLNRDTGNGFSWLFKLLPRASNQQTT